MKNTKMDYGQNLRNGGRFETSTKTKIPTEHGNILKVTSYQDGIISNEYRIRPICSICNGTCGCICFNDDNSSAPFKDAHVSLQKSWVCEKPACHLAYIKKNDPVFYQELFIVNNGNIDAMGVDALERFSGNEMKEGGFCGH